MAKLPSASVLELPMEALRSKTFFPLDLQVQLGAVLWTAEENSHISS